MTENEKSTRGICVNAAGVTKTLHFLNKGKRDVRRCLFAEVRELHFLRVEEHGICRQRVLLDLLHAELRFFLRLGDAHGARVVIEAIVDTLRDTAVNVPIKQAVRALSVRFRAGVATADDREFDPVRLEFFVVQPLLTVLITAKQSRHLREHFPRLVNRETKVPSVEVLGLEQRSLSSL